MKDIKFRNLTVKKVLNRKGLEEISLDSVITETGRVQEIGEEMKNALDNKGKIYAFYYKKELVSLYVFDREWLTQEERNYAPENVHEEAEMTEQECVKNIDETTQEHMENIDETAPQGYMKQLGNKIEQKYAGKAQWIYRLKVRCVSTEYEQFAEKMDETIQEEIKEQAIFHECAYVVWQDEKLKNKQIKPFNGYGLCIGICLGVSYGIVFDNLALGIGLGICFGMCYSLIFSSKG